MDFELYKELQQQVAARLGMQKLLYEAILDTDQEALLAVFFGPFPHPAAAVIEHEPNMYQIIWQGGKNAVMPSRTSKYLFSCTDRPRKVMIWLPANECVASSIMKKLWNLNVKLPGLLN